MKNKILIIIGILVYVTASSYATNKLPLASKDTIPEATKTIETDSVKTDTVFSDLEKELDELNGEKDTTKFRVGKLKIAVIDDGEDIIINRGKEYDDDWDEWDDWDSDKNDFNYSGLNKKFKPHWAGFGMGLNNYMTSDFSTNLPDTAEYLEVNTNKSYEFVFNIAQLGVPIVKHRIGLVTGVGFKWNNYKFNNPQVKLLSRTDTASYLQYEIDTVKNYQKSKLTVSYLTIPLMLEFQIPIQKDPLYLSAGVEAGLKLGSHTKMKTTSGSKTKDKSDFHVSPYTLALSARLGYGSFGIYGNYSLQTLFKDEKGPELYPFTVGVTLNF